MHNFLSNGVYKETDKQTVETNQRYRKHNLLCQGGNDANKFRKGNFEACIIILIAFIIFVFVAVIVIIVIIKIINLFMMIIIIGLNNIY